jgi:hypothetical protein
MDGVPKLKELAGSVPRCSDFFDDDRHERDPGDFPHRDLELSG